MRQLKRGSVQGASIANPAASVLRLRLLVNDLINEVESLDERSLSIPQRSLLRNGQSVNFYEEVERFEIALIRSALRQTRGHQLKAARLLHLNPSTLNAKIKHYSTRAVFYTEADTESGARSWQGQN